MLAREYSGAGPEIGAFFIHADRRVTWLRRAGAMVVYTETAAVVIMQRQTDTGEE